MLWVVHVLETMTESAMSCEAGLNEEEKVPSSEIFRNAFCPDNCTGADCGFCGRTLFTHEDEDYESLLEKESKDPGKYREIQADGIGIGIIEGKQVVWDCDCERFERIENFIVSHEEQILRFLKSRNEDRLQRASRLNELATGASQ